MAGAREFMVGVGDYMCPCVKGVDSWPERVNSWLEWATACVLVVTPCHTKRSRVLNVRLVSHPRLRRRPECYFYVAPAATTEA
eukprot:8516789-Pyramimonas_sp.AAC.1